MHALAARLRSRVDLVCVLLLAALLRVVLFAVAAGSPERFTTKDSGEYIGVASHLRGSYLGDSGPWFDLGLRRTPGYPLFLRGVFETFGTHYAAVVAVQLVVSVATVWLVYALARLVLPDRFAVAAAFLLAVDPASIVFANQLLSETLFAFVLSAAVYLLVAGMLRDDPWRVVLAGLVLGVGALIRPVATYLPLAIVVVVMLPTTPVRRAGRVLAAALLVLGFALPVGVWVTRNTVETGVPIVSTIDGHNMLNYRAVGALIEGGEKPWVARADVRERLAARVPSGANAAEVSREQLRLGLRILAEHPADAAKSWARGEGRLLFGPARAEIGILVTGDMTVDGPLRLLVAVSFALTLVLVLGAAIGTVGLALGRIRIRALWILVATAVYLVAISGGPEAYSRFRVPVSPLLAVLAASSLTLRRLDRQSD